MFKIILYSQIDAYLSSVRRNLFARENLVNSIGSNANRSDSCAMVGHASSRNNTDLLTWFNARVFAIQEYLSRWLTVWIEL